jgi:hypothetical protein
MDRKQERYVYGEHVADLLPGLFAFRDAMHLGEDGMYHSSVCLEPSVGNPLARAMMRAEAELLREDADRVGTPEDDRRTQPQRAADAFIRLAHAVAG